MGLALEICLHLAFNGQSPGVIYTLQTTGAVSNGDGLAGITFYDAAGKAISTPAAALTAGAAAALSATAAGPASNAQVWQSWVFVIHLSHSAMTVDTSLELNAQRFVAYLCEQQDETFVRGAAAFVQLLRQCCWLSMIMGSCLHAGANLQLRCACRGKQCHHLGWQV